MQLERVVIDNRSERLMATGAIVSTQFLKEFVLVYKAKYVDSQFVKIILNWCTAYFKDYKEAPKLHIKDIFNVEQDKGKIPKDVIDLISDFLTEISTDFEKNDNFNYRYVLDQTINRFKEQAVKLISSDVEKQLGAGAVEDAEKTIQAFKAPANQINRGINPFTNTDAICDAYEECAKPLFSLPGAVGELYNEHLIRDSFICLTGHEKVGKTFNLLEWCIFAAKSRCNVAFFEVGDMTQPQVIRRLGTRLTGRSDKHKYCAPRLCPVLDCLFNQMDQCYNKNRACKFGLGFQMDFNKDFDLQKHTQNIPKGYTPCTYCRDNKLPDYKGSVWFAISPSVEQATWRDALVAGKQFIKRMVGKDFKLVTYANSTCNTSTIINQLDSWEATEGFIPDVIAIDYADIMAPESQGLERRDQHDERFKALRRLSQERHCLVLTATQSNSEAYKQAVLNLRSYSEDKRKNAHITLMVGLNQTETEKAYGLMRYNIIAAREGDYSPTETVTALQCLSRGKVIIDSFWTPESGVTTLGRVQNSKSIKKV